jgi:hypothetical protein
MLKLQSVKKCSRKFPISIPATNNAATCIPDNTLFEVFLADAVIARTTFSTGFLSVNLGHKAQRFRFFGCCV